MITNERVVRDPAAAAPAAALAGVPTAQRLARALGDKYEVRRLVGRGGFAEVYELWDKDLDRRLACKVLHPEIAWTPGMLARFRQEAKALARLQHPAILPIHFAGDGEGLVYYVMRSSRGNRSPTRCGAGPMARARRSRSLSRSFRHWLTRTRRDSCTGTSSRTT